MGGEGGAGPGGDHVALGPQDLVPYDQAFFVQEAGLPPDHRHPRPFQHLGVLLLSQGGNERVLLPDDRL